MIASNVSRKSPESKLATGDRRQVGSIPVSLLPHHASRSFVRFLISGIAMILAISICAPPARAIDLEFNFVTTGVNPSTDPTGSGMQRLFDFAETFYEDAFPDVNFAATISVTYAELGLLGAGGLYVPGENLIRIDPTAPRPWFIDPTPEDNSEFDMSQVLWRDLTSAQKADWYNFGNAADVPATFEVGYVGTGKSGLFNDATQADMLNVVLHEAGHVLGLAFSPGEFFDGDYDFDPDWVDDTNLAAQAEDFIVGGWNFAHLQNPNATMFADFQRGRVMPSHTDLFAMAHSLQLQDIDVPRREFYGGTNWHDDGNWSGEARPGEDDEVYVRLARATLDADGAASRLHVHEGARVTISSGAKLDVRPIFDLFTPFGDIGDVEVFDLNSLIVLNPGGELEARDVLLDFQGSIRMNGGTLDVARHLTIRNGKLESTTAAGTIVNVSDTLTTEHSNSEIHAGGGGTMTINATNLVNNGTIRASSNSVVRLESNFSDAWDLDGTTENGTGGVLEALGGEIIVARGGLADTFHGRMTIDGGGSITMPDAAWSLSDVTKAEGWLVFNGDGDIQGGPVNMAGTLEVRDGVAQILMAIEVFPTGTITVEQTGRLDVHDAFEHSGGTINVESNLSFPITDGRIIFLDSATISGGTANVDGNIAFKGTTVFNRGTYQGEGRISFAAGATINPDANISVRSIFVSGPADNPADVLVNGATLTPNDVTVANTGGGTLRVEAGGVIDITAHDGEPRTGNGGLVIGLNSNADGNVIVTGVQDGARSGIATERGITIGTGQPSVGRLAISDGGAVVVGAGVLVGWSSGIAGFTGEGHITVGGASEGYYAELAVVGDIRLRGSNIEHSTITINDGGRVGADELIVWNGSTVTQTGGELHLKTLDLDTHGGAFDMSGGVLYVDTIVGDLEPTGGTIAPGNSPGTMLVTGDYLPQSGATLEIEIGGLLADSEFDQLIVNGDAILGGDLNVILFDLGNGLFEPSPTDTFTVLTSAALSGTFDNVANGQRLDTLGGMGSFLVGYDGTTDAVVLSDFRLPDIMGDTNFDGLINIDDLNAVRNNFGAGGLDDGSLEGDAFPFDGMVDIDDLNSVRNHFGAGAPAVPVPEPAGFVLAAVAGLSMVTLRRRGRRETV